MLEVIPLKFEWVSTRWVATTPFGSGVFICANSALDTKWFFGYEEIKLHSYPPNIKWFGKFKDKEEAEAKANEWFTSVILGCIKKEE